MSEFKDWYNNVPFFTRYWLTFTIVLSLAARFGIFQYATLILEVSSVLRYFQVCDYSGVSPYGYFTRALNILPDSPTNVLNILP